MLNTLMDLYCYAVLWSVYLGGVVVLVNGTYHAFAFAPVH